MRGPDALFSPVSDAMFGQDSSLRVRTSCLLSVWGEIIIYLWVKDWGTYVNPLGMTQKVVGVIEMNYLYDTWYSFVLLRPNNKVNLPTQSAEIRICMGKWTWENLAILLLKDEKTPDNRSFSHCRFCQTPGKNRNPESSTKGQEKKYNPKNLQFLRKL